MPVAALILRPGDEAQLRELANKSPAQDRVAQRARIVLLAAEGMANMAIARQVGASTPTVATWRNRYHSGGIDALADLPRPRRPSNSRLLMHTVNPRPARFAVDTFANRTGREHLGAHGVNSPPASDEPAARKTIPTGWQKRRLRNDWFGY